MDEMHPPLDRSRRPHTAPPSEADASHLKLLMVFHFVAAGLIALLGSVPVIHIVLGIFMVNGTFTNDANPPPPGMGWMFIIIGAVAITLSWTLAILTFFSGLSIRSGRRYWFTFITACLLCLWMPIGTVL